MCCGPGGPPCIAPCVCGPGCIWAPARIPSCCICLSISGIGGSWRAIPFSVGGPPSGPPGGGGGSGGSEGGGAPDTSGMLLGMPPDGGGKRGFLLCFHLGTGGSKLGSMTSQSSLPCGMRMRSISATTSTSGLAPPCFRSPLIAALNSSHISPAVSGETLSVSVQNCWRNSCGVAVLAASDSRWKAWRSAPCTFSEQLRLLLR
mmetsp:Transcript_16214/g.32773  ORF Transcript_16214/g.32773 Transcript_16214/m.32773 type:complete len:203 (-) Transcript_16214:135-743(-)